MTIDLTKQEYRQLIDLVCLGDMMIDGALDGKVPPQYVAIREKIYSHAKEFGYDDLIEYDESMGIHTETAKYDESPAMDYPYKYAQNAINGFE